MTTTKNTQNTTNQAFLDSIGDYKTLILTNIASHYGITINEAYDEVADEKAEHILDYITGANSRLISISLYNNYLLNNNNTNLIKL